MKRLTIILLAFVLIASACKKKDDEDDANAEFVSKSAEKKVALLEEFTGVRCGYCPDGAKIAAEILTEHPGQAIAIGIHGGPYSMPYSGDPDLSTPWADQLISFSRLTGFPSGMVNRRDHDNNGRIATGRGGWKGIANTIVTESAPVNIAIRSKVEGGVAKITVQIYYTADGGGANLLNVAITESGIGTKQAGSNDDPYIHTHVLRDLITGQWGKSISSTKKEVLETFELTYKLKSGEVASKMEVVAFITKDDHTEVLNAEDTKLVDGETN